MASVETWEKLRYFKPDSDVDNWGDPNAINDELLLVLDDFRHFLGVPVCVTSGTSGAHAPNSYHYTENGACAVDVAIPDFDGHPIDLLLHVFRFPFTGVGYYPDWRWNGKPANGLHLDTRPHKWDDDFTKNYRESRWLGVKGTEKQLYLPLTFDLIETYTKGNKWNLS